MSRILMIKKENYHSIQMLTSQNYHLVKNLDKKDFYSLREFYVYCFDMNFTTMCHFFIGYGYIHPYICHVSGA